MDYLATAWAITSAVGAIGIGLSCAIVFGSGPTLGELRVARYCLIAPAMMLAATDVGWTMFTSAPWWWRTIAGVLVGATVFVALPEALRWIKDRQIRSAAPATEQTPQASNPVVHRDCIGAEFPTTVPASGELYVMSLAPIEGLSQMGPGVGTPGERGSWASMPAPSAAKCTITNYSDRPLFNVKSDYDLEFREVVKNGNGTLNMGQPVKRLLRSFTITKLNPGSENAFVFYLYNRDELFVHIRLPDKFDYHLTAGDPGWTAAYVRPPENEIVVPPASLAPKRPEARAVANTSQQDFPYIYAVPSVHGDRLNAIYAAVAVNGDRRQHNIVYTFTALTKDKPMKGAGEFAVKMLDPGSMTTRWEMDPGDYFILIRSDEGTFRESLSLTPEKGNRVRQTIRILNSDNETIFEREM